MLVCRTKRYWYSRIILGLRARARHLGCKRPKDSGASFAGAARAEVRKTARTAKVKRISKAEALALRVFEGACVEGLCLS